MKKRYPKKQGFTLIELLVVVAIIGVLATVVVSSLSESRERAKEAQALADMRAIYTAFNLYLLDNNGNGINLPPRSQHGFTSWHEADCSTEINVNPDGNDFPNGALLSTFSPEMDEYIDTNMLNPWGYEYEIDSSYLCRLSDLCSNDTDVLYALVANRSDVGVNLYRDDAAILPICTHPQS